MRGIVVVREKICVSIGQLYSGNPNMDKGFLRQNHEKATDVFYTDYPIFTMLVVLISFSGISVIRAEISSQTNPGRNVIWNADDRTINSLFSDNS